MVKQYFILNVWFIKTDFRHYLIYQSHSLANILLLRYKQNFLSKFTNARL